MRRSSLRFTLPLWAFLFAVGGCRVLPFLDPSPSTPAAPGLRLHAVESAPLAARVTLGGRAFRLGPDEDWSTLVQPRAWSRVRVEPIDPVRPEAWYGLDLFLYEAPPSPLLLPLLPRATAREPYGEMLDLLAEWVTPFHGPILARWDVDTLRVLAPPPQAGAMYRNTCLEAMDVWNQSLGHPRLALGDSSAYEVRTTVSEEAALAYTRIERRAPDGRPLAMRVHLSPRWTEGSERYVRRVWLHEFAHVLGLWGHSVALHHLTNSRAVVVDRPHPEELRCLRWLYALPNGFSLAWFDRTWSSPLGPGRGDADSLDVDRPTEVVLEGAVEGLQPRDPGL